METMNREKNPFSDRQVRDFVKGVRREVGDAWKWLTPRIQEALIAERALLAFGLQASETIKTEAIHALLNAMLIEAGLRSEGR